MPRSILLRKSAEDNKPSVWRLIPALEVLLCRVSKPDVESLRDLPYDELKKPRRCKRFWNAWSSVVEAQINAASNFASGEEVVGKTPALNHTDGYRFVWPSLRTSTQRATRRNPFNSPENFEIRRVPAWSTLKTLFEDRVRADTELLRRWRVHISEPERVEPSQYFKAILASSNDGLAVASEVVEFGSQVVQVLSDSKVAEWLVTASYGRDATWDNRISSKLDAALSYIYDARLTHLKGCFEDWKESNQDKLTLPDALSTPIKDAFSVIDRVPLLFSVEDTPIRMYDTYNAVFEADPKVKALPAVDKLRLKTALVNATATLSAPIKKVRRAVGLISDTADAADKQIWDTAVSVNCAMNELTAAVDRINLKCLRDIQALKDRECYRQIHELLPYVIAHAVHRELEAVSNIRPTQRSRFQGLEAVAEVGQFLVADGYGQKFYELLAYVSRTNLVWHHSPHRYVGIKMEGHRKTAMVKQFPNEDAVPTTIVLEHLQTSQEPFFPADSTALSWLKPRGEKLGGLAKLLSGGN